MNSKKQNQRRRDGKGKGKAVAKLQGLKNEPQQQQVGTQGPPQVPATQANRREQNHRDDRLKRRAELEALAAKLAAPLLQLYGIEDAKNDAGLHLFAQRANFAFRFTVASSLKKDEQQQQQQHIATQGPSRVPAIPAAPAAPAVPAVPATQANRCERNNRNGRRKGRAELAALAAQCAAPLVQMDNAEDVANDAGLHPAGQLANSAVRFAVRNNPRFRQLDVKAILGFGGCGVVLMVKLRPGSDFAA
ncbi:hypothetical protein HDU96_002910, partial [Phlyctochytrium bullatum]